jgi:hypothetical protein
MQSEVREMTVSYGGNFTSETGLLRLHKSYYWDDIAKYQYISLATPRRGLVRRSNQLSTLPIPMLDDTNGRLK